MVYIIRRNEGGYVAPAGSAKSYVRDPLKARRFDTFRDAAADCCGNETPVSLHDLCGLAL